MSAVDTFRDAIFGNPPSPTMKPSREGVLAAFTELYDAAVIAQAAAQAGITIVSSIADRDTFYATPANRSKLVYINNNNGSATDPANGVYEFVGGSARIAQSFYQGLATVVQPLVDEANAAVVSAQEAARNAIATISIVPPALSSFRNYIGSLLVKPLISGTSPDGTVRIAHGIDPTDGAMVHFAPVKGPGFDAGLADSALAQAVPQLMEYTGDDDIPLLTANYRTLLSVSRATGEPLWRGQPLVAGSVASERRGLSTPVTLTDWNGAYSYGQSLSVGDEAHGVISTSQPYTNLMPAGGLKAGSNLNATAPLIEQMQGAGGGSSTTSGETIVSAMANYAVTLALSGGDIATPGERIFYGGAPGLGGQTIAQLSKGTAPYNRFLAQVSGAKAAANAASKTYSVQCVAWIQGEQDAEVGTTRAAYLAALLQLRSDLDADIKAITGQTAPVQFLLYQTSHRITDSAGRIALAQMDAVKRSPLFHFVTPVWLFPRYDYVHLTAVGYHWMGRYFGRALHQMCEGYEPDCLMPLSATTTAGSLTMRVKYRVPAAPIQLGSASLPAVQDNGMRVTDDSGTVAISSARVVNGDTIEITLGRALASNARWRVGLDYPGSDNGRATCNIRDSTGDAFVINGESRPLFHVSPAQELPIITLEA